VDVPLEVPLSDAQSIRKLFLSFPPHDDGTALASPFSILHVSSFENNRLMFLSPSGSRSRFRSVRTLALSLAFLIDSPLKIYAFAPDDLAGTLLTRDRRIHCFSREFHRMRFEPLPSFSGPLVFGTVIPSKSIYASPSPCLRSAQPVSRSRAYTFSSIGAVPRRISIFPPVCFPLTTAFSS